ncbi:MAG TPA: 4-hydroxy-3-methylbut-2-enyl diphosphate reductase [Solirubrobacteraceae bacterium]|nr:4-hydroxy-3-methylbut-2-enyl diphosphate reductase [Solirubrobacteraceae bacterium]
MNAERLLLLAPMGIEAALVRRGAPDATVAVTGIGPRRASRAARRAAGHHAAGVAVTGFGGALAPELKPGDVVVASELVARDGKVLCRCPGAAVIAGMLRRDGLNAHVGPVVSVHGPAFGRIRAALAETGALLADMESASLAPAAAGRPLAVVRVVLDTGGGQLRHPVAATSDALRAARALRAAAGVLSQWAREIGPREVVLAAPRASCAGVERAIEVVERALDRYGAPVYMRKQIVHNRHVVDDLERRGAVCVDQLEQVPDGATVVFSAHGVSPQVRAEARRRQLNVVDATCPLVNKVHAEARRFGADGFTIFLIGHEGHEEVEGTSGEMLEQIRVIDPEGDLDGLDVPDSERVAYLTQTTLAVDETRAVIERLRTRFPEIVGPRSDDICYATQNRQDAVRALAADCDLVLVVGSRNSSNSNRLVEVARRAGCPARLLDDESQLDPAWLRGVRRIGITAGASSPERMVQRMVGALTVLGPLARTENSVADETIRFALPPEVREPSPVSPLAGETSIQSAQGMV